ncbi:MAG: AMP-binding protein, partial [Gammaproteobacteria bacterium]|nr:AMP-binding protein [Gammaproteobacteria bacterium]
RTPGTLLKSYLGFSLGMQQLIPTMPIMPRPHEMRLQAPASFQQTTMYIAEEAQESLARADYNQLIAFGASGKLDVEAMKMAFAFLWRRHQVLRTGLVFQKAKTDEGRLFQVIHPPEEQGGTIPLEVWDCSNGWNNCSFGSAPEVMAAMQGYIAIPFDMAEKMVRSLLVKLPNEVGEPNMHVIVISIHHAIMDGWSIPIIVRDLLAAYWAYVAGDEEPIGLSRLPLEYADYATWQWQHLEMGGHLEQQLEYWTKQLANLPTSLSLPFDRPRLETSSGRKGSRLPVFLPGKLIDPLADICAQHHITIFVGLMAAFQLVLSRLAGNIEDLVVGTPNAGRDDVRLQEMVGCLMETLVIRGDLKGSPSFSTLLKRQGLVVADALQHGNVPLHRIMQCLQVPRVSNCNPVYQVVLNFLDIGDIIDNDLTRMSSSDLEFLSNLENRLMRQDMQLNWGGNGMLAYTQEALWSSENMDILLYLFRPADTELLRTDGIKGFMCYNSELFDRSTVVMMVECFKNLLDMAVKNPHKVVWELPILAHSEECRQLVEWNKTLAPCPKSGWMVHEFFQDQVRANPNAVAVVEYGGLKRVVSYAKLYIMAEKVARQMRELGVEADVPVGLLMTNDSAEAIAAIYGVLIAGGAYVPLDPSYPDQRIKFIAVEAELKVLLVKDEDTAAKHRGVVDCPMLSVVDILNNAHLPELNTMDWHLPSPSTSCYVIYTSGTTGNPKGVVLQHGNLSSFIQHGTSCVYKGLGPGSRFLNSFPMVSEASCGTQFSTLSVGATLVLASICAFLGELELLITTEKITHLCMTPSLFELIVKCDLTPLVCISLGGECVPQHQLEMWRDKVKHFVICYGPTETTVWCTALEFGERPEHSSANVIGVPIPNITHYVLDTHLQPVPVGVMGELYIGGHGVGRGYLNRPDLTRKAFIKNPFSSNDGSR